MQKKVKRIYLTTCALGLIAGALLAQTLPAPTEDRVGFPAGYQNTFTLLYVLDRPDTKQIRAAYGNDLAASVKNGEQGDYPYGSIIVGEFTPALRDANGNPILDANGRFQKDPATPSTINVMRKEKGFGVAYERIRNGEWEYVAYRPDGTTSTPPQNSGTCANCHLQAGAGKDWVFRAAFRWKGASGAVPDGVVKNYKFIPGVLTVKAGSWVTFYNDDVIEHNIVDDFAGGGRTPNLKGGGSVSILFGGPPGELNYHCSIHPNMRGKVVVVE